MKPPKKVSIRNKSSVFIVDEKDNNLLIASSYITGDYQSAVMNTFVKRYNDYNLMKCCAIILGITTIILALCL